MKKMKYCISFCLFLVLTCIVYQNKYVENILHAAVQNGYTCDLLEGCSINLVYDSESGKTLHNQFDELLQTWKPGVTEHITKLTIHMSDSKQPISHTEWSEFLSIIKRKTYLNPLNDKYYNLSIQELDMSNVLMEKDCLPDQAFTGAKLKTLILPDITELKASHLDGVTVNNLSLPETLTRADNESLSQLSDVLSKYMSSITVNGDVRLIRNALSDFPIYELHVNMDKLEEPYEGIFQGMDFTNLIMMNGSSPIDMNLSAWYGLGEEEVRDKISLEKITLSNSVVRFKAENITSLSTIEIGDSLETLVVKNCGIEELPSKVTDASKQFKQLDVSGNYINFTDPSLVSFYQKHKEDPAYVLGRQKPVLNVKMKDIVVEQGSEPPTIQPIFVYGDGTIVDFEHPLPWMAENLASYYEKETRYEDTPKLDMNVINTYTRRYFSHHYQFRSIGEVIIKVVEKIEKKTPEITLICIPNSGIDTDTEVELHAFVEKEAGDLNDLHSDASVTFFDGEQTLGNSPLQEGSAILSDLRLVEGTHTIIARYSGNRTFTEAETSLVIDVTEPTPPEKDEQSISFSEAEITITYGDPVPENTLVKENADATGAITYTSSDPSIMSVDAATQEVTVHATGKATITATIAEDDHYKSAATTYTIQIDKKPVQLQGIYVKDKVYDGSTQAVLDLEACTVSGIVSKDIEDVELQIGNAQFQDANVGRGKPIQLEGFHLQGDAKENYELVSADLVADITKKDAVIVIEDAQREIGEENPIFRYHIQGLVETDHIDTLEGYVAPVLTSSADLASPAGQYAIQGAGASADNYVFTYADGTLTLRSKRPIEIQEDDYTIQGTKGNPGWYVSEVTIVPANGYEKIWNGEEWGDTLVLMDGIHRDLRIKLKTADETITSEAVLPTISIDTVAPELLDVDDRITYLMNRCFHISSEDIVSILVDGQPQTDRKEFLLFANETKQHTVVMEDLAGNQTTYVISTQSLADIQKQIETLTETDLDERDVKTITQIKQTLLNTLQDNAYQPTAEQKISANIILQMIDEILESNEDANQGEEDHLELNENEANDTGSDANKDMQSQEVETVKTGDETYRIFLWSACLLSGGWLCLTKKHSTKR